MSEKAKVTRVAVIGAGTIGPENMALKAPQLRETDAALPADKVIASSTSGQTITTLRTGLTHPDRMLAGHPFNPPHLILLVELVAGSGGSPLWTGKS